MTKDLLGWYYAQSPDGIVQIVQFLDGKCYYLGHEDIMAEPICRVPEYEEYKQLKKFKHWEKISCDDELCCKTVKELRRLLKKCIPYINDDINIQMSVGHFPELEYDLMEHINTVLGESEE